MNAEAVFVHDKCLAETKYHNMCVECQRAYDYNTTMKWHRHLASQCRDGYDSNAGTWKVRNGKKQFVGSRVAASLPVDQTKLESKWISFPDGNCVKKLASE